MEKMETFTEENVHEVDDFSSVLDSLLNIEASYQKCVISATNKRCLVPFSKETKEKFHSQTRRDTWKWMFLQNLEKIQVNAQDKSVKKQWNGKYKIQIHLNSSYSSQENARYIEKNYMDFVQLRRVLKDICEKGICSVHVDHIRKQSANLRMCEYCDLHSHYFRSKELMPGAIHYKSFYKNSRHPEVLQAFLMRVILNTKQKGLWHSNRCQAFNRFPMELEKFFKHSLSPQHLHDNQVNNNPENDDAIIHPTTSSTAGSGSEEEEEEEKENE